MIESFDGALPEVIIECAGNVSAAGLAIGLLASEGTIAPLGLLGEPVPISQLNVMLKEAKLRESFAYRPEDFDEAIEHLAAGRVPAEDLISSRIPLSGAADAFVELLPPGTSELKIPLQPALAE
jgi:(R,R)-butanediol dehydrogenase/meso-butanediol dehydrogenase/diacetyl reductase